MTLMEGVARVSEDASGGKKWLLISLWPIGCSYGSDRSGRGTTAGQNKTVGEGVEILLDSAELVNQSKNPSLGHRHVALLLISVRGLCSKSLRVASH